MMSSRKRPKSRRRQRALIPDFDSALQLHMQGLIAEAEAAYRRLIASNPQDARLFHLLGRLLHQKGKKDEAIENLRKALKIRPDDTQAMNDLGLLYQEVGALDEAVLCFTRLIEMDPGNAKATNNLGVVLNNQNRLAEAAAMLKKAASLEPQNADAFYNLGNTLKRLNDWTGSSAAYRQALAINPKMLDVYPKLAAVLRRMEKLDEASKVFEQWLEHEPNNPIARHLLAAGSNHAVPVRATPEYVRAVFNEYAETYDQHLQELANRGPHLIAEALYKDFPTPEAKFDILDIGCGTGLCGGILKPLSRRLVGVDLAPKMLEQAQQLGIYDELVEMDLVDFLNSRLSMFDVVVSGDTFGYFGDPQPVLAAVRHALRDEGLLVCTVETGGDKEIPSSGYLLMKSGRYRHAQEYLATSLSDNGFIVRDFTSGTLRMEAGRPVDCVVIRAVLKT
jgi:predicted TPR repeat methyltransferase